MNAQLIANTVASSHHHDSVNAGENKKPSDFRRRGRRRSGCASAPFPQDRNRRSEGVRAYGKLQKSNERYVTLLKSRFFSSVLKTKECASFTFSCRSIHTPLISQKSGTTSKKKMRRNATGTRKRRKTGAPRGEHPAKRRRPTTSPVPWGATPGSREPPHGAAAGGEGGVLRRSAGKAAQETQAKWAKRFGKDKEGLKQRQSTDSSSIGSGSDRTPSLERKIKGSGSAF